MLVGITYDLRDNYLAQGYSEEDTAELDKPETIDAIDQTLRSLGFETDRIGSVKELMRRLMAGERWDVVFNVAEGLWGFGREALVPALLDAYRIPYTFSDPLVLAFTLHKASTKRLVRDCGIPTPDFFLIESQEDISAIRLPFPVFAKPVAEGTGKGVTSASKITSRSELVDVCSKLLWKFKQPVLVETFLPGREFTVGIVGSGKESVAIGAIEIILKAEAESDAYSYVNKDRYEQLVEYHPVFDPMAERAKEVAVAAWRALGCRDGGRVDLRADGVGVPNFIEVNPLAGLHPKHSDLPIICSHVGLSYRDLIERIMQSALKRISLDAATIAERR